METSDGMDQQNTDGQGIDNICHKHYTSNASLMLFFPDTHPLFIPLLSPLETIISPRTKGKAGVNL